MEWKTAKPYVGAFIVAFIGALFASGGVALTYLARVNPGLAAILGAGFAVLIGFVKILPTPEQVAHPQITVDHVQNMPTTVNPPAPETPPDIGHRVVTPSLTPQRSRNAGGQFTKIGDITDH